MKVKELMKYLEDADPEDDVLLFTMESGDVSAHGFEDVNPGYVMVYA